MKKVIGFVIYLGIVAVYSAVNAKIVYDAGYESGYMDGEIYQIDKNIKRLQKSFESGNEAKYS